MAVTGGGDALEWNGTAWSAPVRIEPGPAPTVTLGVSPTGVSCPAATFCVAVDNAGGVLEWTGSTWARVDVDGATKITGISCPTTSFCLAVDQSGKALVGRP
jgi:hypothetical protein